MTTTPEPRVEALVLLAAFATAKKKATVAELKARVKGYFDDRHSVAEITTIVSRVVEALVAGGFLEPSGTARSTWYAVTEQGRARLEREYGGPVEARPWKALTARHLVPVAGGVAKFKLPHDFGVVRAAMIAEALGFGDRLTRVSTEAAILNRIAAALTESKTDNVPALQKATVRRWLRTEPPAALPLAASPTAASPPDASPPGASPPGNAALDLDRFAYAVRSAAADAASAAGTYKAFISHVWRELQSRDATFGLDERGYHHALLAAHRKHLVQLTPASLAPSYSRADLDASEIRWHGETFHFISTDDAR